MHSLPDAADALSGEQSECQTVAREPRKDSTCVTEQASRRYTGVVLGACVAAFVFGLWNARNQWFIFDEWAYWTQRRRLLESNQYADFFLEPHGDHLHAIVMALWLPLDRIFGAKTYIPYVAPTILVHCVAGFLLFKLLLRMQIRPAIAAATAVLYLFLENAAGNVSFGWQIVFVAPIALCYLALLALEHYVDGGGRWLAVVTVASVVVAVVSSGVAITVMVVIALAAAARRRFMLAAAVLAIPGGLYLLWRHAYDPPSAHLRMSQLDEYASYVREGLQSTLEDVAQVHLSLVAVLLFLGVVAGIVVAIVRQDRAWPVLVATFVGAIVFYALLATQRADDRAFGAGFEPWAPRYVHVASALMLPPLAYGVDRLIDVRRWMAIPAIALVLWAGAMNLQRFTEFNDTYVADTRRARAEIAATVAIANHLQGVSGFAQPWGIPVPLRIGTLRHLADKHKLPCSTDYAEVVRVAAKLGIPAPPRSEVSCRGR